MSRNHLKSQKKEIEDGVRFNSVAQSYLALFISFSGLTPLASGGYQIFIGVLAVISLLAYFLVAYRKIFPQLVSVLSNIPIRSLAIFLGLSSLAIIFWSSTDGGIWIWLGLVAYMAGYVVLLLHFKEVLQLGTKDFTKRERRLGILIMLVCFLMGIIVGMLVDELITGMIFGLAFGLMIAIVAVRTARKFNKTSRIPPK